MMMIPETNALHRMNAERFERCEKPLWFGDTGESNDRHILQNFRRNSCFTGIQAVVCVPHRKRWNRNGRNCDSIHFLYACRMCTIESALRFAPSSARQQSFAGFPFHRIDRHDIDVAMKTAMLKAVIQDENVPEFFLFGDAACLISIGADHHRNVAQPPLHEKWLITRLFPVRSNHENASACTSTSARQHDWMEAPLAKRLCESDHERRPPHGGHPLDGAAELSGHQPRRREDARVVELL